jgi:hypothetical protein
MVTEDGDPSRGARFNSAVRYIDEQRKNNVNCLAIIVSEDGYVDFLSSSSETHGIKRLLAPAAEPGQQMTVEVVPQKVEQADRT